MYLFSYEITCKTPSKYNPSHNNPTEDGISFTGEESVSEVLVTGLSHSLVCSRRNWNCREKKKKKRPSKLE